MAGYLIPVMLLLCGALLWFNPAQRAFYSLLAIVLALGSWITSNLGGFFIGMLLGLVGGALAFAWATAPDRRPLKWFSGNPQVLQPSSGVDLVLRPTAVLPPPGRAELISADGRGGSGYRAPDSADKPGIGLVSIDTLGMVMTGPSTSTTLPQDDDGDHRPHGRLSNVTQPQDDASGG